jgi:hypothetical protein
MPNQATGILMITIGVFQEDLDGTTVDYGLCEFDALPAAGDYVLVPQRGMLAPFDENELIFLQVVCAYHLPKYRTVKPRDTREGGPYTRVKVKRLPDPMGA